MGRVDDAMRRAAGLVPEAAADDAPAGAAVIEQAPAESLDAPEAAPDAAPASLFEHLDPGLAEKVVVDDRMMAPVREQYRRLAAALHHAQAAEGLKVVMIASAVEKEGKTLTSSNLALTLSESYRRSVLLIDADLRRPSVHTTFGVDGSPGLSEGLMAPSDQKLPLHRVTGTLTILPAGRATTDPMAGLTSPRMRNVLDEAREAFDWVIIDTPPVGLLTDANLLASMVDATVMVVKAGSTPYHLVRRAVESIGSARLLGVVLNLAAVQPRQYGYGYYGYHYASPAAEKP